MQSPELPSCTLMVAPLRSRRDCTVSPLRPMTWPMSEAGTRHLYCVLTGCAGGLACSKATRSQHRKVNPAFSCTLKHKANGNVLSRNFSVSVAFMNKNSIQDVYKQGTALAWGGNGSQGQGLPLSARAGLPCSHDAPAQPHLGP